jgi:multidrug resistance efflux pump
MQRLRHVRVPDELEARRVHAAERRSVVRKETRIWSRRLRVAARVLLVVALIALAWYWLWGGRFLADGLVEAELVLAQAPARARVAEVYCAAGDACEPGQPLLRLESLESEHARRALELALAQSRLRLAVVEAGGELGDVSLAQRGERVAEAEREARLAEAEIAVTLATLERLARERLVLELAQREQQVLREGRVESLAERVAEAQASIERASVQSTLSEWDVQSRIELNVHGIVSDRDVATVLSDRDASRSEIAGLSAARRSLSLELESARAIAGLGQEQLAAHMGELEGRSDEARARLAAWTGRRDLWRELAARQRALGAGGSEQEAARLRELELQLLRLEEDQARTRLAEHDLRSGTLVVRAEARGVVERLWVGRGSVVASGDPLVRTFDPSRVHVVAYVERDGAARVRRGQPCRILVVGSAIELDGHVDAVDDVWTACPPALPALAKPSTDMRLPVHVQCSALDERLQLRPNMRVRVVFKDETAATLAGG